MATRYKPLVDVIRSLADPTSYRTTLLEAGSGAGLITILIKQVFPTSLVLGVDIDPDMIKLARQNVPGGDFRLGDITTESGYFDLSPDVIYSHGVLEHFDDNTINKILKFQRAKARWVVHYVPLEGHGTPSFGDERLLPLWWWNESFLPNNVFTFNGGKDVVLVWKGRLQ